MQPPPRKTRISVSNLKTLHSEQISKLQHKHQHELDLLEDIRIFTKRRSEIEKEYAQSLCKLAQQYLSKGKFSPPPILAEDGSDAKTVSEVWKTVLDETDHVGKIRLQAADTYLQQISDPVKSIKSYKAAVAKKVFEHLKTMHKEMDVQVTELSKSQKVYNDDEHVTLEATSKANDAESKVKNKSTGIFTSLAKLQQQSAKLLGRKETCEVKSTSSRNDYLLNLAATNAHLDKYYSSELPEVIVSVDGDMFDKVRDFFITFSKMEVDCCGLTQERFMRILTDSTMISRQFDNQCFLHKNLVFTDKVQYNFEPQDTDPMNKICQDHNAAEHLQDEAKKLAERAAHDGKTLRINRCKLNLLLNLSSNGSPTQGEATSPTSPTPTGDKDAKIDTLRQNIRKAELSKKKTDAKLDALRTCGVNIDELLAAAEARVEAEGDVEEESRSQSQVDGSVSTAPPEGSTYVNYQEDDFDETFTTNTGGQEDGSMGYSSLGHNVALKAIAVYDFQGSNNDELSMAENEPIEVVGEGEGDGWVQARNASGRIGLVPQNYIQYTDTNNVTDDHNEMNVDSAELDSTAASAGYESSSLASASAPTSAGYDSVPPSAAFDSVPSSAGTQGSVSEKSSSYSTTDYEVQQAIRPNELATEGMWARALYDFEATCDEELSFHEGQMIRIIQKDENGVDDGWWKGEIDGKIGVFPSLVVEEAGPGFSSEA